MAVTFAGEEITLIIRLLIGIIGLIYIGYGLAKKKYKAIAIGATGAFALHTIVDLIKLIVIWCK